MKKMFVIETFTKPRNGRVHLKDRIDRLGPAFETKVMAETYLLGEGYMLFDTLTDKPSYTKNNHNAEHKAYIRVIPYFGQDSY